MLGSLSFMWDLLVQKVPFTEILRDLRTEYGPLFLIQTGPAKQVWVSDPDMLKRILGLLECCGRPATFEDPFGGFLFFTADPEKAVVSREQQRAWLAANLQEAAIQPAVDDEVQRLWPSLDIATPQPWPAEAIKTIFYAAITRALLGDDGLMSDQELTDWMAATKDFTEQSSRNMKGKKESKKRIDGAERIKEIVLGAMERAGRDDAHIALPVLVASTVGGTEHIPNLLHWTFLYFMREPSRQEAAAQAAIRGDSKSLLREIYAALRRMPYSGAIGPPRKIVADVEAYDMLLPKGALVFAMHPAIVDEALGREPPDHDDFSSYVFGVGPRACLGKQISEALLPAVVGAILRRYRVEPADSAWYAKRLGEQRGQLNYPVNPPLLCWKRRDTDQSQRPSSEQQQQSQLQSVATAAAR
jgi:cytochrome P450